MVRKGQAAMEYLMTYGWAILVIVIVLAALLYLGVFNITERTPNQCNFKVGILCTSAKIDVAGGLTLKLQNTLGTRISVCQVSCAKTVESGGLLVTTPVTNCETSGFLTDGQIPSGQAGTITDTVDAVGGGCWGDEDGASDTDVVNEQIRCKVYLLYSEAGDGNAGNARIAVGDLQTTVQP